MLHLQLQMEFSDVFYLFLLDAVLIDWACGPGHLFPQKESRDAECTDSMSLLVVWCAVQRQTAVTAHFSSEQLLLFAIAPQCC